MATASKIVGSAFLIISNMKVTLFFFFFWTNLMDWPQNYHECKHFCILNIDHLQYLSRFMKFPILWDKKSLSTESEKCTSVKRKSCEGLWHAITLQTMSVYLPVLCNLREIFPPVLWNHHRYAIFYMYTSQGIL